VLSCISASTPHPANPVHTPVPNKTSPRQFCDKGTLRDAVKAFTFHQELEGGAIGVDVTAAVDVLQDIAYAVQYLHNVHLVHGDIKVRPMVSDLMLDLILI
jgi:serine/threonine protein kinase